MILHLLGHLCKSNFNKMEFAVELTFDDPLKYLLRDSMEMLNDRDVTPLSIDKDYEPYLTLLVTRDGSRLHNLMPQSLPLQGSFPISFIQFVLSPRLDCCLLPLMSPELIQFHRNLFEKLVAEGLQISQEYHPGSWTPNCMLAQTIPGDLLENAFRVARNLALPFTGRVEQIRFVRFPSRNILSTYNFWEEVPPPGRRNYFNLFVSCDVYAFSFLYVLAVLTIQAGLYSGHAVCLLNPKLDRHDVVYLQRFS